MRTDGFSSVRNRRSARTGRRPRNFERCSSMYRSTSAGIGKPPLRAPRANHVFGTDEKRIRTENMVIDKSTNCLGLSLSKIIDCTRTDSRPRNITTLRQPTKRGCDLSPRVWFLDTTCAMRACPPPAPPRASLRTRRDARGRCAQCPRRWRRIPAPSLPRRSSPRRGIR
jgi:hypothetical protein